MTPPLAKGVEAAIADRDLWRVPEALSACGETIKLPDAVFEHLLRIPLGLNAFEWRTRWNKAWAADWHSDVVQKLQRWELPLSEVYARHYEQASLARQRAPQLPAHDVALWNAPEFVNVLGLVLGYDAVRIPAEVLRRLRGIPLCGPLESWEGLFDQAWGPDFKLWPTEVPRRALAHVCNVLWEDYKAASEAHTHKTQTPDRWEPPVFVEVPGGRYVPPAAVVKLLRTAAVGLTVDQWHKLWDMAWAAGTTGSAFAMWDRAQPTPRELSYISKGYWKSYQAHYERVTKPYGIFTKADYDYGFNTGVIGKTVSEMTHKEAIAAIGVLQKSLDYQIREVTRLKQLAKAMTDGAQLSQPEPAKRASMGPLEQTTWAPVGGSAARVFTSRAAARDAEVKK